MKLGATVYVFDVDGVLCEIGSFTIDERIISLVAGLLRRGIYCAINTGRGYGRVDAEFVEPLKAHYPDVSVEKLLVTTEMGGAVTTYKGRGSRSVSTKYAMTRNELKVFYDVWEAHKNELFAMYVYKDKQSMASTVRDHCYDEPTYAFQKAQFEQWLRDAYAGTDIVVMGTTESTDVYASHAGKNAGAANIIAWLRGVTDIKHDTAICFGDSHNDYEMAREFAEYGFATTFVYTGEGLEVADPHDKVKVIDTKASYTGGTIEYLQSL